MPGRAVCESRGLKENIWKLSPRAGHTVMLKLVVVGGGGGMTDDSEALQAAWTQPRPGRPVG